MKKMFIDDIQKKGDMNSPGSGRYDIEKRFGSLGLSYSMAQKLKIEEAALLRSKKLPGPGSYIQKDMTGKLLDESNFKTESMFSFARDLRFGVPTKKITAPSPDKYSPMTNLNQNYSSTF